jgi:hypothetical protein
MADFHHHTCDQIAMGATETATRATAATGGEVFALVAVEVSPFHLDGANPALGAALAARVPAVATSRADSARTRLASTAVSTLVAHARRPPGPKEH